MDKTDFFEIRCPCCKATLRVDLELRAVISHEASRSPAAVTDLADAARALREKESRRDEQFQKSVAAQRDRGKLLERKFEEAFEKAKQDPAAPPPLRDFDLD